MAPERVVAQGRCLGRILLMGDFALPTKVIKSETREILRGEKHVIDVNKNILKEIKH